MLSQLKKIANRLWKAFLDSDKVIIADLCGVAGCVVQLVEPFVHLYFLLFLCFLVFPLWILAIYYNVFEVILCRKPPSITSIFRSLRSRVINYSYKSQRRS